MTSKTLLSGGCVLTLGAKTPNFTVADVLIDGSAVAEVGPGSVRGTPCRWTRATPS